MNLNKTVNKVGRFKELAEYKKKIMLSLISSENIVKAVGINNADFLDREFKGYSDDLLYNNIFPYVRVPDTNTTNKTFITMSFGRYKLINNSFKTGVITFYIFTHKDLMHTIYSTLRTDYILSEIDELLNQSRKLGIGKLQFKSMDDFVVSNNADYSGVIVSYEVLDWN